MLSSVNLLFPAFAQCRYLKSASITPKYTGLSVSQIKRVLVDYIQPIGRVEEKQN